METHRADDRTLRSGYHSSFPLDPVVPLLCSPPAASRASHRRKLTSVAPASSRSFSRRSPEKHFRVEATRARVMGSMIDDDDDDDADEDLSFHVGRTLYDRSLSPRSRSSLFLSRAAKRFPETKQTIPRQREIKSNARQPCLVFIFCLSFHEG